MYQVIARSDRKKNPTMINVENLTWDELKSLSSGRSIHILDQFGKLATVKITSIKTRKRRPYDIEIHVKYGLYEYFVIQVNDKESDMTIVKIIYDE